MKSNTHKIVTLFNALNENEQKLIINIAKRLLDFRYNRLASLRETSDELCLKAGKRHGSKEE